MTLTLNDSWSVQKGSHKVYEHYMSAKEADFKWKNVTLFELHSGRLNVPKSKINLD